MSERPDSDPGTGERENDREGRAEALLIEGLDCYLSGHYDDAIHVWTRVLFLDRTHERARAYIDRARTAQAERRRRADEMLHRVGELVAAGAVEPARTLLTEAEQASTDEALVARLWTEIERAGRSAAAEPADVAPALGRSSGQGAARLGRAVHPLVALIAAGALGALLVTVLTSSYLWGSSDNPPLGGGRALRASSIEVPAGADVALIRARALYQRGRLAEALAVLDRVTPGGPNRATVDALRVEIQGLLLSTVSTAGSAERRP